MKVPLSWLREYVDLTLPLDELVHRLNMSGTEVEGVAQVGAEWEQVFVAKVVALDPHPNAPPEAGLYVARLDVGSRGLATVVTGAANLSVGVHVPLVQPGGTLPGGREIRAEERRGIRSEGMLCSGDELGLSPDRSGIYVLDEDANPSRPGGEGRPDPSGRPYRLGQSLRDVLGDMVLDLYITPNRPDCMSVFGVAREVHAITGAPLRRIQVSPPHGPRAATELVRVEIADPDLCRRFTAAYVGGLTMGPSPGWLQRRLHLAGVRPISNVVDATNYTMLELGQPQHAFDADRLGDTIVVRRARQGERIVTLDGVERELETEMLAIADAQRAVAVAGVMGGADTEVDNATRNMVLETANFAPGSIRRTARELRLASEASRRFERGLDPELAMFAAQRTVSLLLELCGGQAADGIVDVYPGRAELRRMVVHEDDITRLLGRPYARAEVVGVLESLDFGVGLEPGSDRLVVSVPGHRGDVEGRADLAEEVARITGYDAIPNAIPTGAPPEPKGDPLRVAAEAARDVLVGCGLREVMTYSLVAPESEARLLANRGEVTAEAQRSGRKKQISVTNPLSVEHSVLRTTLLPSLIDTARANLRQRDGVTIFELARVYLPPLDPLPTERTRLAIVLIGRTTPRSWTTPPREADFFDLKGIVEELLASFGLRGELAPAASPGYQPGQCAEVALANDGPNASDSVRLGLLGRLHPRVAEAFDLPRLVGAVYAAELEFDLLAERLQGQPQIRPLSRFPALERDLALVVDRATPHAEVAGEIRTAGGDVLGSARLFDLYEGPQVPPGKKSLAFTLRFRAHDRTLTDDEADAAVEHIVTAVTGRFGARVRGPGEA